MLLRSIILVLLLLSGLNMPAFSEFIYNRMTIDSTGSDTVWSGLNQNGTALSISEVKPGEWNENENVSTAWGSYSNRAKIRGQDGRSYTLSIKVAGDLMDMSTGRTMPASSLRYIFTYAGGAFTGGKESDASGTRLNYRNYVNFSASPQNVYISSVADAAGNDQETSEREFQFKYGVIVPKKQPPGTYTTTITYAVNDGTDSGSRTADISVTVGDLYALSVDRGTVDFEKMTPGQTKDNVPVEGVILLSQTNQGNPWFLKISSDSPLSSGPDIIPGSNFIWYGWTDGKGIWHGNGTDQINLVPMLMYSSGATETYAGVDGVKNHLKFKLTVPKGQPGGRYMTNVKVSMMEAAQETGTITVTVLVEGKFGLMVNTDSFDFSRLMPGQVGEMSRGEGVTVVSSSTNGNPWFLKVSAKGPLASGENTIPNENFAWTSSSEGKGESYGSADTSFAGEKSTAYVSTAGEANSGENVANRFKFKLKVPEDTKAGVYTTTVMFTMTE